MALKRLKWLKYLFVNRTEAETEQQYWNEKRKKHLANEHTEGIVVGLEVTQTTPLSLKVKILGGRALDANGDDPEIESVQELDCTSLVPTSGIRTVYLTLRYQETDVEPYFVDEIGDYQNKYVQDGSQLEATTVAPAAPAVELARIKLGAGATQIKNAVNSQNPQTNEIDLRYRQYSGKEVLAFRDLSDIDENEADAFNNMENPSSGNPIATVTKVNSLLAPVKSEVETARGSKSSLDQRLDVSLNNDGTLKTEITSHVALSDMPDAAGTNSDHDARYLKKAGDTASGLIKCDAGLEIKTGTELRFGVPVENSDHIAFKRENVSGDHSQLILQLGDNLSDDDRLIIKSGGGGGIPVIEALRLTNSGLLTLAGNLILQSGKTVDGRDVSVDGAKLDTIESNATGDQTATEILNALKTVDGIGSGLDADLLDGVSHRGQGGTTEHPVVTPTTAGFMSITDKSKLDGIESGATADQTASEILTAIRTVDGSGSGLDADTLDGKHASDFITNPSTIIHNSLAGLYGASSYYHITTKQNSILTNGYWKNYQGGEGSGLQFAGSFRLYLILNTTAYFGTRTFRIHLEKDSGENGTLYSGGTLLADWDFDYIPNPAWLRDIHVSFNGVYQNNAPTWWVFRINWLQLVPTDENIIYEVTGIQGDYSKQLTTRHWDLLVNYTFRGPTGDQYWASGPAYVSGNMYFSHYKITPI